MQVQRTFKTFIAVTVAAGVVFASLVSGAAPSSDAASPSTPGAATDANGATDAGPAGSAETPRVWNLSPAEQSQLAEQIIQARVFIEAARSAQSAGEHEGALGQLEKARTLLEGVMDTSPAIRTKSRLWVAMNMAAMEDPAEALAYMDEVDAEIAAMETYAPVGPVRARANEARAFLAEGQKPEAAAALEAASEAVELGQADVPSAEAFYLVNVAMAATIQGDASVAGKALEMASESAETLVEAVPVPASAPAPAVAAG